MTTTILLSSSPTTAETTTKQQHISLLEKIKQYQAIWQWQWQTFIWYNGHWPKITICDNEHQYRTCYCIL